jgi:murein DD-endopeptidase MepM/ murein hydrolase activator NlpD
MTVTKILLWWCAISAVLALGLGRILAVGRRPARAPARPGRRRRLAGGFVAASAVLLVVPLAGRGGADLAGLPQPVGDTMTTLTSIVGATTTTTSPPTTTAPEPDSPPSTAPPTTQPENGADSEGSRTKASSAPSRAPWGRTAGDPLSQTPADGVPAAVVSAGATAVTPPLATVAGVVAATSSPVVDLSSFAPFSSSPSLTIAGGPRSTLALMQMLDGLDLPPATVARIMAPFPVAGAANYSDDWGAPRATPTPHSHQGVDVFAARGTPVIAAASGTVTRSSSTGAGGNSVRLTAQDGTYYYYAHLERFAPAASNGGKVAPGDVLGFVGTTGNAEGGLPHLHFEIHPDGGAAVPPVPYLDRWLKEATDTARAVADAPSPAVEALRQGRFTAAVGLPPRLAPLERAAARRDGTSVWPILLVVLAGVIVWRGWVAKLRRAGAAPTPPPAEFRLFD